ncbi:hypothetical protein MTP99_018229 [Tenebrio molitor]|nr:hypothetical protein MTP99_018229 [Tenebrio molitor]
MKLITVVIIGAFVTITSAIRVPTSWPNKQKLQETQIGRFRTTPRPVRSEIGLQTRPPHVVQVHKHGKVNGGRKHQQQPKTKVRHRNVNRPQVKKDFKASATAGDWKPIFPTHMVQRDDEFFKGFEGRLPVQVKREKSPLHKNYRDDKTHEPGGYETVEVKHVRKEKPSSVHEDPLEVPTRPIYPGEGQWAKKGKKHRPFISKHKFTRAESEDEEEEKPEGREVFEENEKLFEKKREDFREDIDEFPRKHKLGAYVEVEEEAEDYDDDNKEEFVPIRLYTQVRRSESEAHLPKLEEDPRLREVIKDSKIQTVYTEEGYEDIAYDHAGHEKNAEHDEGFSQFDREIEKEKQRRARKERVEDEGGESDSQIAGSRRQTVEKPFKSKKDNFVTIKEIKTTSLKDKVNGNSELEVLNEIKIMTTPENGTRAHRYVRIFPKMYIAPDMSSMESAISKSVYRRGRRSKRFTNDFPEIKVDTDFIDKIKHDLPRLVQIRQKPKYPYYNDITINPNSPLRYAEDLDNIPKKTEDPYAFYNQAEKIQCAEVETEVDPIPARVKNADSDPENVEDATDVQELVRTPRLKGLGDKIDCFKMKYFGEDPLDSPIFKEKEIGPVPPIFGVFKSRGSERSQPEAKPNEIDEENNKSYSIKVPVQQELKQEKKKKSPIDDKDGQLGFNILTDIIGQFNKSKGVETATTRTALKLEIVHPKVVKEEKKEDTTQSAVISIITTPKYTIDLKPKHIYHQIELLEYLPQYNSSKDVTDKNSTEEVPPSQRRSKNLEEEEEVTTAPAITEEAAPESQALRKRRRRIRPHRPYYHIFDVNRYLPPRSYALLNKILRTSPTVPKRDALNQVEIKANEQLNVFADVINNIKNSSKDPHQIAASSNRIAVKLNHLDPYRKHPRIRNVETDLDNIEQTNSFYLTTTTTTAAPRGTVKYSSYKTMEHLFDDMANRDKVKYENLELLRVKKRLTTTTEPYGSDTRSSLGEEEEEEEEEEREDEEEEDTTSHVLGLMPPGPSRYKTIVAPKLTKSSSVETKMNHFYVLGMKPPSAKQKIYLYSDFKVPAHGKVKLAYLRRGKRSAQRPAYSEVVRNRNKPIDVEDDTEVVVEDDDDYVPHRPKNYHYDEKTGRIVYDDPPKDAQEPEEEYIEVTEAPLPKPTRRNSIQETPKFKNFTGPSFVDFVKQLKSNPNYQPITDPPTTEKGQEDETTTTTTVKPVSTDPPQFLSILAKVRSDSSYKAIEDKTTAKTTTTTTTEAPEEETQLENVQNSPGGQSSGQNFQIFDITDYLPKVKSYSPRTSIDYSKYKTIERPSAPSRHNISSRYSSEEDSENVKVSKMEEKSQEPDRGEINPVMSESKHEDVEPSTSSTTTEIAPTTTTPRRIRTRTKTRGRRPAQRSTTVAPVVTTASSSVSSTEPVRVHHDKPRRSFPRRRPSRIKINRTTELPDSETDESTTPKVIRRRHQRIEDVPVKNAQDRIDSNPAEVVNKTREVASLNATKNNESLSRSESRNIDDVHVFQQYDQKKKHGGNYKHENVESESKKVPEVKRLTDVVQKPATYYTDPKLPKKINQLMEVNVEGEVEESTEKEEDEGEGEYDYEGSEEKSTTTKKPVFVKDPSKRLYYYAPV